MKRVYVAGAYSGSDVITILKNIGRGEYYAAKELCKIVKRFAKLLEVVGIDYD